jgi:hypothetical protein
MDIISVGSRTKPAYLEAQRETFGSHPSVRRFFGLTEENDVDQGCLDNPTNLVRKSVRFCRRRLEGESHMTQLFGAKLFAPRGGNGWLCAQKRPIDGLHHVLQQYLNGTLAIPSYLAIIDDDTYLNMDLLLDILLQRFSSVTPYVLAGFNLKFIRHFDYTFPLGGYGSFLLRAAIQRLIHPIDCSAKDPDPFTRLNCWRLSLNYIGEANVFRNGMSVSDLMFQYSTTSPFSKVSSWKSGFCLHSDVALGYFFDFYHIAVPDQAMSRDLPLNDHLLKQYKFTNLTPDNAGTSEREGCSPDNHVCHYTTPQQMHTLYRYSQIFQRAESANATEWDKAMKVLESVNTSVFGHGRKNEKLEVNF